MEKREGNSPNRKRLLTISYLMQPNIATGQVMTDRYSVDSAYYEYRSQDSVGDFVVQRPSSRGSQFSGRKTPSQSLSPTSRRRWMAVADAIRVKRKMRRKEELQRNKELVGPKHFFVSGAKLTHFRGQCFIFVSSKNIRNCLGFFMFLWGLEI